jgi:hypothetical protein
VDVTLRKTRYHIAYFDQILGPRVVGGVYWTSYWRQFYVVQDIELDWANGTVWIEVANPDELVAGRSRRHCTPWDKKDRVIHQPLSGDPTDG